MAKYRRKPSHIEAVPYEEGMEDGFDFQQLPHFNIKTGKVHYDYIKRPYIESNQGVKLFIPKDDVYCIVTDENGERRVISKEELEKDYEFMCK